MILALDMTQLVARLVLASVFLVSGVAKLSDLKGSRQALNDFHVPATLAERFGWVLPVAEIILSGISGSATADAAGLSTVSIGTMVKKGYPRGFSAGVVN